MADIYDKAMLVHLNISFWTARKFDKKATEAVEAAYGVSKAGRFNKILIEQENLKNLQKITGQARAFHYTNTLPWLYEGVSILPSANFLSYSSKIREFKEQYEQEANKFADIYPQLIEEAKNKLGSLFNPKDYPDSFFIRRKFTLDIGFSPLPKSDDFRVNLAEEEVADIKQKIESSTMQALHLATKSLWERLYENVSHMAEKLRDESAVFRNSLVENLADLCELLPKLNVLGDKDLEDVRKKTEDLLCSYEPEALREDYDIRAQTAKHAEDILAVMAGYVGK